MKSNPKSVRNARLETGEIVPDNLEVKPAQAAWNLSLGSQIPQIVWDAFETIAKASVGDNDVYKAQCVVAAHIEELRERVEHLMEPLEFDYEPGRPLVVVKLGCANKGWVPNQKHFDSARKMLKASGVDKKKNVLLYHYAIHIEQHDL